MHIKNLIYASLLLMPLGFGTAQAAGLGGTWRDPFGTSFVVSSCGSGTDMCAVLKDIRGKSRTPANLAYVNKRIMQVHKAALHQWQGTMVFNGSKVAATVTEIGNNTLSIKGCEGIFCGVLIFSRH